jgi:thiamine-monophosphate kinase
VSIAEIGEFGLISRVVARLGTGSAALLGPGDDAAVVAAPDGRVVASTDVLVEGRHFRRDWSGPADIGHRAAAANLADIAAMGATPTALLVAFCAPADLDVAWAEELAGGLSEEAALVGASVVGGDMSSSRTITIAVTALGDLGGAAPLTRSGARPGDVVAVRGRLGFASAGLELLTGGRAGAAELIAAHRRPEPPYGAGGEARAHGATALLDVSDGLVQDLGHIADASGVRIEIDSASVPVPRILGPDGLRHALTGGEDHAFAGTFPGPPPPSWSRIGVVTTGSGVRVDGREPPSGAWDHFAV